MKRCWAQYLLWLVVVVGAGSLLSACGQKGDLVRPGESATSSEY